MLRAACEAAPGVARFREIGRSEDGRPIVGVVLGHGARQVSLIAGAHADEPVGPETLRTLILGVLAAPNRFADLLATYTLAVVPHINPDGEAANRPWIAQWPSLDAFVQGVVREPPGRDLEFGFPAMRPENEAVSACLADRAPLALHMSLHGMTFSEGAMLLVERHWCGARTAELRAAFAEAAARAGLRLHDHNRAGEKGFFYIDPGFTTTPEGAAMQAHFRALGDEAMAAKFHRSSMEQVRTLGGDPLCLVTELPLFLVEADPQSPPGTPRAYLAVKDRLAEVKLLPEAAQPAAIAGLAETFGLRPLPLRTAMRLQVEALALGLAAVR